VEEEFVTYEQALALKELGFDEEPCLAFYDGEGTEQIYFNSYRNRTGDFEPFIKHKRLLWFGAPLKQQVFRWFREKYGYYVDFIIFDKEDYASPISKRDDIEFSFVIYRAFDNLYSNYDELFTTGYSLDDEGETVWDSYEEAEDDCINTLIELAKQKSNV
jgi:hypothetical protein